MAITEKKKDTKTKTELQLDRYIYVNKIFQFLVFFFSFIIKIPILKMMMKSTFEIVLMDQLIQVMKEYFLEQKIINV